MAASGARVGTLVRIEPPDHRVPGVSIVSFHGTSLRRPATTRTAPHDRDRQPFDRPRVELGADVHEDRMPYGTHLVAADLPGVPGTCARPYRSA
ncbi:hypothetical protein [Streptomyces ipomoeae]|uniref:hypothetical protein n=1 Tax=Streptomyces ipomoeae TaxID=103232 RepID=UPI0011665D24|nr:hypothetical protein [Streptomyces ipomoeae]MDX2935591.1 hypothetical protein [Streptomyces ipomoeae]TQE18400.1 hypothetical protein SipoB123_34190 [Streptomyces ipomoeae]